MEETICEYRECATPMSRRQLQKSQKFCSRKCFADNKVIHHEHVCDRDGCQEMTANPKYCSHSCSATMTNIARPPRTGYVENQFGVFAIPKRRYKGNQKIEKTCPLPECGKTTLKTEKSSEYCCNQHRVDHLQTKPLIAKWRSTGDSSLVALKNGELRNSIIKFLKKECDYTCSQCSRRNFHPIDGAPEVQVDHINGDNKDHRPSNLRVLCLICHWETDTYCGRNKN